MAAPVNLIIVVVAVPVALVVVVAPEVALAVVVGEVVAGLLDVIATTELEVAGLVEEETTTTDVVVVPLAVEEDEAAATAKPAATGLAVEAMAPVEAGQTVTVTVTVWAAVRAAEDERRRVIMLLI